jgi:hypothetical protein
MKKPTHKNYKTIRKNIELELCANNDGRKVCPPSKVLCKECLDLIGEKLRTILLNYENRAAREKVKQLGIKIDENEGQERIDTLTGKKMSDE